VSSYSIAAELGCRATTVSRALRRHRIRARMGRPAVVVPGQVYGRLTVLGELRERSRGGRVFRCRCARGRETGARAVELRQGKVRSCGCLRDETRWVATPASRACTAGNATDGSSCCTRQGVRAQATPGCSAVAATAAARRPCAAPTSPAATPAHADAYSSSTANADPSAPNRRRFRLTTGSFRTAGVGGEPKTRWLPEGARRSACADYSVEAGCCLWQGSRFRNPWRRGYLRPGRQSPRAVGWQPSRARLAEVNV
jgi:hypothetical protein